MKNIYILLLISLALITMSNRGGRNQPSTGAPGENGDTCATCHGGGAFDGAIDITLTDADGNSVDTYKPGQEYTMTIQLSGDGAAGFGFQAVPLASDDAQAGSFADLGEFVRDLDRLDRTYLLQSNRKEDGTFTASWTAPNAGRGDVTFYSSGIAANGNNGTSGDQPLSFAKAFGEDLASSTYNTNIDLTIFPNPTTDFVRIDQSGSFAYEIYNIVGNKLCSGEVSNSDPIDVSRMPAGSYLISVEQDGKTASRRFVKR